MRLQPAVTIDDLTAAEGDHDMRRERVYQRFNPVRERVIVVADEEDVVVPCVVNKPLVVSGLTEIVRAKFRTDSAISGSDALVIFGYLLPDMPIPMWILADENLDVRIGLSES